MIKRIKRKIRRIISNTSILKPLDNKLKLRRTIIKYNTIIEKNYESELKTSSIEVINLNATDVCNSGCTMCNIWKQKREYEFTSDELCEIIKDPLFNNLKHVGITGGEPTLRKDLPLLFEAIIKAQPNIYGLSTITNCIREKDVIERIDASIEICNKYNKSFSMMVSLDGIGEVHDKVRGKKGNFETAINVLNYFRNKNINIATGTTISKINVWDVDETLFYLRENDIYGRFRVAEFIKRLYNDDRNEVIRNFDKDETYHLILFFYKLIFSYETNETFKNTYYSIINILSGGKRLIQCPYQNEGIVLNSMGEIAYCAPKSKVIGNAIKTSAIKIYNENISELKYIKENHCATCIHDYHAPLVPNELKNRQISNFWREYIKLDTQIPFSFHKRIKPYKENNKFQIFITGWYGTETVGDKAILGGIIDDLIEQYGKEINIIVTSLYPHITKRTLFELNVDAKIIDSYSESFIASAKGSDLVIMGGGPLMDLEELALPFIAFKLAKSVGCKTKIYGCGIGPLFKDKYINIVKQILQLSDDIALRDKKSVEIAHSWVKGHKEITFSGDYAKKYLHRYDNFKYTEAHTKVLSCYLRELTHEYYGELSETEFKVLKKNFEQKLAFFIQKKATEFGINTIRFEHMHNFVVGGDDRDFSRYFIKNYFKESPIHVEYNKKLSSVDTIVECMKTSSLNICMRFHSVLFAESLKTEFIALDYTAGGKIYNYLNDHSKLDSLITIEEIRNS